MLQWYAWGGQRQEGRISSLDDTWADNTTPHQQREVIRQLDRGEESLTEIGRRDTRAWEQYSRQMGMAMREELVSSSTGVVLRAALARQVDLITSLPTVAAQRVHDLTVENLAQSKRPAQIAEEIMKTGQVTKSRATLIARTEVARTASELTEARAVAVGSTHYIWRGVRDKRERDSHWHMEGRVCEWANPPEVEPGKRYHAGRIYNCRCWPEPIVPLDDDDNRELRIVGGNAAPITRRR